jgi:hypothetical protein
MVQYGIIALFLFVSTAAQAETIVSQRISSTQRLIPLKKLTVGPYDQYHGTLAHDTLVFTRKSDLVPHICSQNIKTGEVIDLLPLTADSQEPALNHDGVLAFTYYHFKASGDICYQSLEKIRNHPDQLICLKMEEGEPSTPFWKGTQELGYLLRDTWTQNNKVILENLATHSKQILAEGKIWSPALSPDGKYLFYNELITESAQSNRVLMMKNLQTNYTQQVRFSLPGISGFPAVSEDGKFLLFSHYLNDTNHDNVIDGKDNSVLFRVPLEQVLKGHEIFPEQLTSVEKNCSFPRPYGNSIYATCAFEGALDIYEIPSTGIVPTGWDEKVLNNAHQTSRTYAERLLILNTLKFRFPKNTQKTIEERIFSNHLFADDLEASQYSIKILEKTEDRHQRDFYKLLSLYLEARKKKKVHPSDEITSSLQKEILEIEARIDGVGDHIRFKKIIKGLLKSFLNQSQAGIEYLKQVNFSSSARPLERYFYFELANSVLPKMQSWETLDGVYREMMSAPELTQESQLYYAFKYLQYLQRGKHSIREKMKLIEHMSQTVKPKMPEAVSSLLKSEVATLKVIEAPNEKMKTEAYRELDQFMSASRSQYFLRKAMYIRSILNFQDAAEFNYLNYVATNWLRYTQNDDTEFSHAREIYANSTLDQAYDKVGKRDFILSGNYFYGSLSLTDDLESHLGYIQSMVARGQRTTLNDRYKNLKDRQFIEDNMKFVEALLILIDARPQSSEDTAHFQVALDRLKSMTQDRDSAIRYLLMGYCSLELLFRSASGFEFDHDHFENAHRDLMLAYDQGRENPRVVAASLMNLGLLHQRVQNHGLAVKFFSKRKSLGFISNDEATRFSWFFARSLFFNHQADKASRELGKALGLEKSQLQMNSFKEDQVPLLERRAFYLVAAEKFEEAVKAYEQLLARGALKSNVNLAKAYLNYGYSLFKTRQQSKAQKVLRQSLGYIAQLQVIPQSKDRWMSFEPMRMELIAYGFLAQLGTPQERIEALEKRGNLLSRAKAILNEWLPLLIQNRLQIAEINNSIDLSQSAKYVKESLQYAEQFGNANQYLAHSVYRSAVNFLTHGILHPQYYANEDSGRIQKVVEKTLHAYDQQLFAQPLLEYQKLMLQVLWAKYSSRVLKSNNAEEISKILKSQSAERLKTTLPVKWKELNALTANF